MNKIFYQDFLMNFQYDNDEFPLVKLKQLSSLEKFQDSFTPFNLFDYSNGYCRYFSLQKLHNEKNKLFWDKLLFFIESLDAVAIVDDIEIKNEETKRIKEFYLKTYFWNFKNHNKNVFVYKTCII